MKAKKTNINKPAPKLAVEEVQEALEKIDPNSEPAPVGFDNYHERLLGHDVKIERTGGDGPWATYLDGMVVCYNAKTGKRERVEPDLVEMDSSDKYSIIKNVTARTAIIEALDFYVVEGKVDMRTWIAKLNKQGVV